MEQLDLIKPLSKETKEKVFSYMVTLMEWRGVEQEPHVIRGIEQYYIQLQKLLDSNKE
jgi:hypothetical protein